MCKFTGRRAADVTNEVKKKLYEEIKHIIQTESGTAAADNEEELV